MKVQLTLSSRPWPDPEVRLRRLLKAAHRAYGFRCESIQEVAVDPVNRCVMCDVVIEHDDLPLCLACIEFVKKHPRAKENEDAKAKRHSQSSEEATGESLLPDLPSATEEHEQEC